MLGSALIWAALVVMAILLIWCLVRTNWGREFRWSFCDSEEIFNASVNGRDPAASLAERLARRRARAARTEAAQVRQLQVLGRIHAGRLRDQGDTEDDIIARDLAEFPAGEDDPELGQLAGQLATLEGELGDIIPAQLLAPISAISDRAHTTRRHAAVKAATNRKKKTKVILQQMETHSSIPENVHDRAVIEDLAAKMAILRKQSHFSFARTAESAENEPAVRQHQITKQKIAEYIASADLPPADRERALSTLDRIYDVQEFIVALDAREDQVLEAVWARADHPDNAANRDLIRQAVAVALRDCWVRSPYSGEYEMVCPNGRAERQIEALTLLDFDAALAGSANTSENYKNEIYRSAQEWNEEALEAARGEPGGELLWRAYQEGEDVADIAKSDQEREHATKLEKELHELVLRKVDAALQKLKPKLPKGLDERIRDDVRAALV